MQDSNDKNPGTDGNTKTVEPSTAPSTPPTGNPFIPKMGVREITATWAMLVQFKKAILSVNWPGEYLQAVAMGLEMIKQMEAQYHVQKEMAEKAADAERKKIREQIKNSGGNVNGELSKNG